jgi:photosystem II stability/assembly factor-like uncharacterized protein
MKHATLLLLLIKLSGALQAQHIEILTKGMPSSIRGLSVVDDQVVWVSGSNGRVGRSLDGGRTWKWMVVTDFEKRDFRDIEAFDKDTAIIMAIAEPANILKTTDGGNTWKTVYENKTTGMFLDAMEFFNNKSGAVIGDPINGKFFIARTYDKGDTWKESSIDKVAAADSGEACFASSGTNIRKLYKENFCFISGGRKAHYLISGYFEPLPVTQGTSSTGANSIAVWNPEDKNTNQFLVVVGGDYANDTVKTNNCFSSTNAGKTWTAPAEPPHGYRSCVEFINQKQLITCGTPGVDVSTDSGRNWKLISKESFHVCRKAKKGSAVFLAGAGGRIGRLITND